MGRKVALAGFIVALVAWLAWFATRENVMHVEVETATHEPPSEPPREKDAPRNRARHADAAQTPETSPPVPPPVPTGPTISGRVVDADGNAVAGARVVSHPDDISKPVESTQAGADGSRSFVATSGADGRFEIRVDPKSVQLVVTVTADAGFGQAAAGPKDRDVEVKLVKWTLLAGRVTNQAKAPVAGAKVTMHLLLDALVEDRSTVSDANGEYRIERLPPLGWTPGVPLVGRGRHGWVIAEADGYAPLLVERSGFGGPRDADPTKLDLVLVRGMTLTGKVVDGDTKAPLVGATVVCWSVEAMQGFGSATSGASISNPWGPRPLGETKSGDDGSFRFEHLPAQGPSGVSSHNSGKRGMTLGHVAAWKEGYVYGGDEIPVSKDETTLETTIDLWPSATITGRVVDKDGKPVVGASAYVNIDERRPALNGFPSFYAESKAASAKTGADGRYSLSAFRASRSGPTTGKLTAYVAGEGGSISSSPVDVTATAGETVAAPDLVIDVGANPRATFIVTDTSGAPVAGATIEREMQPVRTDLDGRASWSNRFAPTTSDTIAAQSTVVRAKGFAPQQVSFTPARGTPADVPVVLKPGVRIAGRVVTADGRPGAKAAVVVADGAKSVTDVFGDGSQYADLHGSRNGRLVVYANVTAGDDGAFEATDLPDGPYLVAAQMPSRAPTGFNRQPKMLRDARPGVVSGATDLVLTIPADDAPPTQPLEIVVTDAAGGAVEKCSAQAVVVGARMYARLTEPTKLRFDALPAGRITIEVNAPGWAKATLADVVIAADTPPQPIAVRLDRGITLRGAVHTDSGMLPDGASLVVSPVEQSGMGGAMNGEIKKDGTFEATGFLPGRYRVTAHAAVTRDANAVFVPVGGGLLTVPDGAREVVVDLTLVRAGSIWMTVRDKRLPSSPFSGGTADPDKDKFGAESRLEVVDATGAVVSALTPVYVDFTPPLSVAPGDYTVRLRLPGETQQEQRCTVKAGETVTVRLSGAR